MSDSPMQPSKKTLRVKKVSNIHRFLFNNFDNQLLLKTLYNIASDSRYLIKQEMLAQLKQSGILDEAGEMDNDVRMAILSSIIMHEDGTITLEIE